MIDILNAESSGTGSTPTGRPPSTCTNPLRPISETSRSPWPANASASAAALVTT